VTNSIKTEKQNDTLIIYLHEPKKSNALTLSLRHELFQALVNAEADSSVKCIVLSGSGKNFSSGGDLTALRTLKPLEGRKRLQSSHPLIRKMLDIEKPIIAAVNGAAAGAGFSLALLCDFIIAAEDAYFIQSFVHVGLVPDFAAMHFLPALIGPQRAKELMFLGEKVEADAAYQLGIINKITPKETLIEESLKFAEQLANKPANAIGMMKKIMNQHFGRDLHTLLEMEAQAQEICFQSNDFQAAVARFFTKDKK